MKKLVIIFVAVILLSGATVGVMKYLGVPPFEKEEVAEVEQPREIRGPDTLFVDMDPLMINVVQEGAVIATIQMEVKIETTGTDNIIYIKRNLPKYQDAFTRDMHAFVPRMFREIERLDLPTVKQRLHLVAERVASKEGIINDVLIQSIVDTPLQP